MHLSGLQWPIEHKTKRLWLVSWDCWVISELIIDHTKVTVWISKVSQTLADIFYQDCFGLPWWCSDWESACQCRGHGFEPCSGKIPHAVEQLSPWATTTEPARLEPVPRIKRGRDSERPAHRDEEWPPLATTRESPRTETKTQHTQK